MEHTDANRKCTVKGCSLVVDFSDDGASSPWIESTIKLLVLGNSQTSSQKQSRNAGCRLHFLGSDENRCFLKLSDDLIK